jgi:hypothetical protein
MTPRLPRGDVMSAGESERFRYLGIKSMAVDYRPEADVFMLLEMIARWVDSVCHPRGGPQRLTGVP